MRVFLYITVTFLTFLFLDHYSKYCSCSDTGFVPPDCLQCIAFLHLKVHPPLVCVSYNVGWLFLGKVSFCLLHSLNLLVQFGLRWPMPHIPTSSWYRTCKQFEYSAPKSCQLCFVFSLVDTFFSFLHYSVDNEVIVEGFGQSSIVGGALRCLIRCCMLLCDSATSLRRHSCISADHGYIGLIAYRWSCHPSICHLPSLFLPPPFCSFSLPSFMHAASAAAAAAARLIRWRHWHQLRNPCQQRRSEEGRFIQHLRRSVTRALSNSQHNRLDWVICCRTRGKEKGREGGENLVNCLSRRLTPILLPRQLPLETVDTHSSGDIRSILMTLLHLKASTLQGCLSRCLTAFVKTATFLLLPLATRLQIALWMTRFR